MRHVGGAIALAIVACLAASAAAAGRERLVMPYACSVEAGRIVLEPAAEQSYVIIGRHEQQPFTACSPADEAHCRTWMLHRFDLDCGGERVSWLSTVAAAAAGRSRRVWLEDGRLHVRFWIERFDERGSPCFVRPWRSMASWPGQGSFLYNRACGLFRAREAAAVVRMPYGFAPVMNLSARFVAGVSPSDAMDDRPLNVATPASKLASEVKAPARRHTPADKVAAKTKSSAAEQPSERLQSVVATAVSMGPKLAPTLLAEAESQSAAPQSEWVPSTYRLAGSGSSEAQEHAWDTFLRTAPEISLPLAVGLIGVLGLCLTAFGWARSRRAAHASAKAVLSQIDKRAATIRGPPLSISPDEQAAGEDLMRTAEAFFEHVAHIARRMKARDALRDVVSDELRSIEDTLRSTALARACAARDWAYVRMCAVQILTDLERVRRVAQSANETVAPSAASAFDFGVPSDRSEALAVLGVNADASEKVVKKIVDAMRQTWHPDLAKDDADRRAREERIKQINSAWDLVRRRAQEA